MVVEQASSKTAREILAGMGVFFSQLSSFQAVIQ